jgi:arylsulfatase A-like enzyme
MKNVILVVFDSLRKDSVGVYGSPFWGKVHTPHFDRLAAESVVFTRAYPESLPTLVARRAMYTGHRCYPFHDGAIRLKGDGVGMAGWGPIPEEQDTLAELLQKAGYRTALISDLYHQFKPSKNFWRGFDQWTFLRGQETDPERSGPRLSQEEIDRWMPKDLQSTWMLDIMRECVMNFRDRTKEEDYFAPRVLREAALWLEQNQDADRFFLTIESFDPHEPWLAPAHYRKMYLPEDGQQGVWSSYGAVSQHDPGFVRAAQANYSGVVTMCDRWLGHLLETMRVLGRLDDTMVIFTSDHGHSVGDRNFFGKKGYPSFPEIVDVPLIVRFPKAAHAGTTSDLFVQAHDIPAEILDRTGVEPETKIEGRAFLEAALAGRPGARDHATIGWSTGITLIDERWWFNCKMDGTGVLLYDLSAEDPFAANVADDHTDVVNQLFAAAKDDAGGSFPEWLLNLAADEADAPGCSDLTALA